MINIINIIFYVLLIDSLGANIMAWFYPTWYKKNYKGLVKHFPATKGWCLWYLVLVLFIGYLIFYL
jgi:hypothetical protein